MLVRKIDVAVEGGHLLSCWGSGKCVCVWRGWSIVKTLLGGHSGIEAGNIFFFLGKCLWWGKKFTPIFPLNMWHEGEEVRKSDLHQRNVFPEGTRSPPLTLLGQQKTQSRGRAAEFNELCMFLQRRHNRPLVQSLSFAIWSICSE